MNLTQLVSNPPLFFSTYLLLTHTFLIWTHSSLERDTRTEAADMYCQLLAALILSYKLNLLTNDNSISTVVESESEHEFEYD